jgi:RNA polymerase sigma factor (sigma-70 family)
MCVSSTGVTDVTANPIRKIVDIIRQMAWRHESQEQSDAQLLGRFVGGDGVALETLVRRHAAMVWSVCRRNLTHHDDAEDAFQATFLVLLRKAASLRSPELLANWLYGVAYKTACKARQTTAKRGAREPQGKTMPEPPAKPPEDGFGTELLALLDRELNGLPEKYRTAIVLCDLQERTITDVAQELRVKDGTVASRLARGREMLAQRMSRHGAGRSAGAVAAVCSQQAASGALPSALLTRTIDAVRLVAAEQPVMAGLLSAEASTLSEAVLHSMAATKWKAASVVLLLAGLAMGGGVVAYHNLPDQPSNPAQPPEAEKPPVTRPDPIAEKFGTAAGASSFARTHLTEQSLRRHGGREDYVSRGPLRVFKATRDPNTHQWTVTGAYRCTPNVKMQLVDEHLRLLGPDRFGDRQRGDGSSFEKDWKLVLSYNSSARGYEVVKEEGFDGWWVHDDHTLGEGWRPSDNDDFGKWLQGRYTKLRPSATTFTALSLVLDGPQWTKLGLERKYAYGSKNMAVELISPITDSDSIRGIYPSPLTRSIAWPNCPVPGPGVSVWIDDSVADAQTKPWFQDHVAGARTQPWRLAFGAPLKHSFKVGEYGGAGYRGLGISVSTWLPERASPKWGVPPVRAQWGGDNLGEFVVREIELNDQKVVRLAIDFITNSQSWDLIVRGSLRYNSRFEPSVPELDPDE